MPIFSQKNVNSVKFTHYDQKSEYYVIFSDISRKIFALMPIYLKKKRPLSKKTLLSCPYFVEKMSILSETLLLCQGFQNFHQKPLAVMPIFDQNRQFYLNYTIL